MGLTLRVLRNALDGVDIDTGIGTADAAGNKLEEGVDYRYSADERSYYALNIAITADNYKDFTDSTKVYSKVSNQLDASKSPEKKVWLNLKLQTVLVIQASMMHSQSIWLRQTMQHLIHLSLSSN